jgi:hypothetical protein
VVEISVSDGRVVVAPQPVKEKAIRMAHVISVVFFINNYLRVVLYLSLFFQPFCLVYNRGKENVAFSIKNFFAI